MINIGITEHRKINKIAIYHRNLQESDLDSINVVSGYKGFGKSNLAFYCAFDYLHLFGCKCIPCNMTWVYNKKLLHDLPNKHKYTMKCPKCKQKKHVGIPWEAFTLEDLWKYVAYEPGDVYDKIIKLEDFSPLCADEAVNFAMGEDWMFSKNKKVKNLMAKCRTKHLVMYLNIPKFSWLQSKYRDDMTSGWFRILRRGLAVFLIPDLGEDQDSWHMKDFNKYLGSYTIMTHKDHLLKRVQILKNKHPCFFDHFHIPRFPDKLYNMYKKIRHYYVFEKEDAEIDRVQLHRLMLYNLRFYWNTFKKVVGNSEFPTMKTMATILLRNHATKNTELTPVHIRRIISDMKKTMEQYKAHNPEDLKKLH